jgi:hypothetical protein
MTISNSEADKEAKFKKYEDYGQREGNGAAARPGFFYDLVCDARPNQDTISLDVSDAEISWDRYARASARGASMIGGMKSPANDQAAKDSRDVRISETRTFIKMGSIAYVDAVEVMDRAMKRIKQERQDGTLKCKPTDAMLAVAREQCKPAWQSVPLDDATIEQVIQPKVANEKKEEDRLDKIREELERITKKFGETDEINNAIAYVQKRIDDLGGTTRAKRAQASLNKKRK